MTESFKVGVVGDIGEDEAIVVAKEITGTVDNIAVIHSEGRYFALDDTCTHEQASLAEGWIEAGCIECPLHAANFRLADGEAISLPATTGVFTHTVTVEGDALMLTPNPRRLA